MFSKERDMRGPVERWIVAQGMVFVFESCIGSGIADVVGGRFVPNHKPGHSIPFIKNTFAIELKLRDIAGVIRQAKCNRQDVEFSWAAMPQSLIGNFQSSTLQKFAKDGVGLLGVSENDVRIILGPQRGRPELWRTERVRRILWRRLRAKRKAVEHVERNQPSPLPLWRD